MLVMRNAGTFVGILFFWKPYRAANVDVSEAQLEDGYSIRALSDTPRIYLIEHLLSASECDHVIALGRDRLKPAGVVGVQDAEYLASARNNEQMFFETEEEDNDPVLRTVLKRMHRAARIPERLGEGLQLGRYSVGQKYELHIDTQERASRPATLVVYLSDVEEGGETAFPMTKDNRYICEDGIWHCCSGGKVQDGIRVPPVRGNAVLFFSHQITGEVDNGSWHGSCQVIRGEKWIAQRWFHFHPQRKTPYLTDASSDGVLASPQSILSPHRTAVRMLSQDDPLTFLLKNFSRAAEAIPFRIIFMLFSDHFGLFSDHQMILDGLWIISVSCWIFFSPFSDKKTENKHLASIFLLKNFVSAAEVDAIGTGAQPGEMSAGHAPALLPMLLRRLHAASCNFTLNFDFDFNFKN